MFKNVGLRITPKIHAVLFHISQFCVAYGYGLGVVSEQASESVLANFKKTLEKYLVSHHNPSFPKQLLRAVQDYADKHVC